MNILIFNPFLTKKYEKRVACIDFQIRIRVRHGPVTCTRNLTFSPRGAGEWWHRLTLKLLLVLFLRPSCGVVWGGGAAGKSPLIDDARCKMAAPCTYIRRPYSQG